MSIPKFSNDVLEFFKRLEKNNDRDWFNAHKIEYKSYEALAKEVFKYISDSLNKQDLIDTFKVLRIYRDVRFSKNKLPYKVHISGSFHRKKPELRGGYYLHIQPGNKSFLGAGFWDPNKEDLLRLRREFEQDDQDIRAIIDHTSFKSIWGELEGGELKTAPRDFDKEHPAIDLIRKKQYVFTKHFNDKEVLEHNFADNVILAFQAIRPFFDYMSDVLTTNVNGESTI
jgi:uncharacterized protein (TIGR02453 family)